MGKRSPIGIRSAEVRIENYNVGIEVGALKYMKKLELMKKHADGVQKFDAFVNTIVEDIANKYGIVGADRGFLQAAGLRLAKFAAKYANIGVDALANLLEAQIQRELSRGGYTPNAEETPILINALRDIAARLIENRIELINKYREAQK